LDLIATDDQGRHVGIKNGTYVTEIPGATASGDQTGIEWISVPEDADVEFTVRNEGRRGTDGSDKQTNTTATFRTSITHYGDDPRIEKTNGSYDVTDTTTDVSENQTVSSGSTAPAVEQSVVAAVTPNRTSVPVTEGITFDASGSVGVNTSVTNYEWDFDGDGTVDVTTTGASTTHTYSDTGTYSATLTVVGEDGATDTTTVSVTVSDASSDLAEYMNEDGTVTLSGLRDALEDWRIGDIQTTLLREVITAWRSG
jgi:PKD repeat protein